MTTTRWSIDTEYGWRGDDGCESCFTPVVLCLTSLDTDERHAFWGRDGRLSTFIRHHSQDLFISYNLVAEVKYLLRLGVSPPRRWWDCMLAFRFVTNAGVVVPFGLEDALKAYGIPHAFMAEKDELQKWIGELRFNPGNPDHRRRIESYCTADCTSTAALYLRLRGAVPEWWMAYATAFALATARMELRGLTVDLKRYTAVLERKQEIIDRVTAKVNRVCPVFANSRLSPPRFFAWCAAAGVGWPSTYSPRTGKKMLSLDKRNFERMKTRHWFIAKVHEANKTCKLLNNRNLVVDLARGKHFYGNVCLGAATGRTTFRGFLLSAPKWMRHLIVPSSPEHLLVSTDFDSEEFGIAAALSHDANMAAAYRAGDVHMQFGIMAGAAPPGATKNTHGKVRKLYKVINLGVLYGQTAYGIGETTGMHFQQACLLLAQHKRIFSAYWSWTDRFTNQAFRRGRAVTVGGWPRKVDRKDSERSVANYGIQGAGADLMRLSVLYLADQGAPLIAVNHDSFLFDVHRDQLGELHEVIDFALGRASEQLFPELPLRWSTTEFEDRYLDEDGEESWHLVEGVLRSPRLLERARIETAGTSARG
jgi:hypothetical protein